MLLPLMAGSKEDAETVTVFFVASTIRCWYLERRPGDLKAVGVCCPHASRQRCLAHRRAIRTTNLLERFFVEEHGASDHPAHFR